LNSFCVPASVTFINWNCFVRSNTAIDVTFESPSRVKEIGQFSLKATPVVSLPDSVESLSVVRDGARGSICRFGRDSRLRDLGISHVEFHRDGAGFMRLIESSLKRLRGVIEWRET
jgi:hypothetical protein